MTPERWQKIKDVLATALEMSAGEREGYLDRSCGDDLLFRADVERLLDHEPSVNSRFLNETALAETAVAILTPEENLWVGRRVGAYQIAELVGAGGMGEVYRAFRADDQYRKQVALKLIRAGQDSSLVIARFKNERQILASLEHPNIARLIDGGTTEDGLPYLVMELIEGHAIAEYCDLHSLGVVDRLRLFLQVCAAVQYAHQNLIVHRDIKPGNILVTADGVPKLLDFGIAKILEASSTGPINSTLTMLRVLTPQYASPEQVKGETITTATDVYSLGVVLYELLTGCSPYASSGSVQDAARAVLETEPLKPSTVVRTRKNSEQGSGHSSAVSPLAASPARMAKQLRGDLDNIILMALRKEPQRRYASVEQFADDIRRYLQHVPVIARKDTARYRTVKFVMRHRAGVTAAGFVALILLVGIAVTLQEARIARRRFADVRNLANSLIFDVHDSIKDLPGSTPARKLIVDRALQYLNVLAKESSGDIQLQRELATAYEKVGTVQGDYLEHNLGDSVGTLASYQKALELRKRIAAVSNDWNDKLNVAQGYRLVAHQMWANGDPRGARDPIDRAVAIADAMNSAMPRNWKILYELSFDHEVSGRIGFPGDARAKDKILQEYRSATQEDEILLQLTPDDLRLLHGYSIDLSYIGSALEATDPQDALSYYRRALEIDQKLTQLSPDLRYRRGVAIGYGSIASVYDDLGDPAHAIENNMKDLDIYLDMVRTDPKNALLQQGLSITYINVATSCSRGGQIAKALDYSSRALEIMLRLVSSSPGKTFQQSIYAAMLVARGTVLIAAGKSEKAIPEIEHGRSLYESLAKTGVSSAANIAASSVKLGEAAMRAGRNDKAATSFHEALVTAEPLISADPPDLDALYATADADSGLGDLSVRKARRTASTEARRSAFAEARSWYQSSLNTWHRIKHPNHTAPNSFQVGDPAVVAQKLKQVEANLSALQ